MDRQAVVIVLSLIVFLGVLPGIVGAPATTGDDTSFVNVKTTTEDDIQPVSIYQLGHIPVAHVSAQAPGQGMGLATHLTNYHHSQNLYQKSYENQLENAENVEQVITDRLNRLEGVSDRVGDAYANRLAREVLKNGMSELTEAAVSETVESASVQTDEDTIRVAVQQTSITDVRGEVHLEFEGDRIFVATESEDGTKSYRGSVSAANGRFGDLDPDKFRGSTPIEALRTACDEITAEEWDSAKEQFSPLIQEEFGVRERIVELASKGVVCSNLEGGGGTFNAPG